MNKVNEILTEWTYQLESGYPKKDEDYIVLQNILQESTDFDQSKIHRIVDRARGLQEDEQPVQDIQTKEDFIEIIKSKYIHPQQTIQNLEGLYNIIKVSWNKYKIYEIILSSTGEQIGPGQYKMNKLQSELYTAIDTTVKIKNGHPSELWFAIIYKGQVEGSVSGDSEIESDVRLSTGETISLKAYTKTQYDLGTLPADARSYLTKFVALSQIVLDNIEDDSLSFKYEKDMSVTEINAALRLLNDEKIKKELLDFLSTDFDIGILEKIQRTIRTTLTQVVDSTVPESITSIDDFFNDKIDEFIKERIGSVSHWAFIIKDQYTVFIRESDTVTKALQSKRDEDGTRVLSNGINNFRQGKLFIKGSALDITKMFTGDEG